MALSSPLEIPGCQIWLDASDVTTLSALSAAELPGNFQVSNDGDRVGYWGDKSGNNRHFTYVGQTTAVRPFYRTNVQNGLPVLRFEGAEQLLSLSAVTLSAQSVFVVTAPRVTLAVIQNQRIYTQSTTGNGEQIYLPLQRISTNLLASSMAGDSRSSISQTGLSAFDILTSHYTGSVLTNVRNGAGGAAFSNVLGERIMTCTKIGAETNGSGVGTGRYYQGDYAEVIMYNRALTAQERGSVEDYLVRKWNTASYRVVTVKTGNWSDDTTWSTLNQPFTSMDVLITNNFTVTIDKNININSLSTGGINTGIASGCFIYNPYNINILQNISLFSGTPIVSYVSAGNVNINCQNILHSYGGGATGSLIGSIGAPVITNMSTGNLVISANKLIPNTFGTTNAGFHVIYNSGLGNITVTCVDLSASPNQSGSTVTNGSCGIFNNGSGNITITGNVYGGATNSWGIYTVNSGNLIVNGNIYGGTNISGINHGGTNSVIINGDIYASRNAAGFTSSSTTAEVVFIGSIFNSDGGRQAVFATRYQVRPKVFNSATVYKNTDLVNLLTRSEELSSTASWTLFQTTITPRASSTFLPNISAYKLIETTANTEHYLRQTILNTETTLPLIFSVYLKRAEARYVVLTVEGGSGTHGYSVVYDLNTNLPTASRVTNSGVVTLTGVQDVGDGWYRYTLGGTNTTTTKIVTIALSNRSDYSGTVTLNFYPAYVGGLSGVLVYGPQAEYRTQTDYVSTDTTQGYVNRNQQPVTYYSPEAYHLSYLPETSSVKLGTGYAAVSSLSGIDVNLPVQLSGTMIVPSPFSVNYGVPVDDTVGVAVLDSKLIWNTDVNTLTANDILGRRLKNTATVQDCGQELLNLNN